MDKRLVKVLIVFLVIGVIIIILNLVSHKSSDEIILDYLIEEGFKKDGNTSLYYKQLSDLDLSRYNSSIQNGNDAEYDMLYFNTATNVLMKEKMTTKDGISTSFSPSYDYKDDTLTYEYRINYQTLNTLIKGSYDEKKDDFTCNVEFSYQIDIDEAKDDICNKIKYNVKSFKVEADTLFKNVKLLKELKKKKVESEE